MPLMIQMLAILSLLLGVFSGDTSPTYVRDKDTYEVWTEACFRTQYTCGLTELPKIMRVELEPGLLGYYDGTDKIYVLKGLRGLRYKEVVMHEMIHYIQKQVGKAEIPGPAESICRLEAEAFTVVDKWLLDSGEQWLMVGPDWWKPYVHCWPWYDPDWAKYSAGDQWIWSLDPDVYETE